jgi:murein DD-endopeptidase MepM/ murein hydrolase activator NlpD
VRRALAAFAALALLLFLAPPVSAADLAGAQKRANAAAARLAAAQTAMAKAEAEIAKLQTRAAATGTRLQAAEGRMRAFAVRRYIESGQHGAEWLSESDLSQATRNQAMLRVVLAGDADAVSEFRTARADLDANKAAIQKRLGEQQAAVRKLAKEQADLAAELRKLEAAAKAEEARKQQAAAARASASRNRAGAGAAAGAAKTVAVTGSWGCPVQGPHAFSNDWGQPRSGGRRHQGNDILAARGTPVVANVSGTVNRHQSGMGGLSYYLRGDDGNTYYGAHLNSYAADGRVSIGTVIGTVGTTGNASGGPPHLHFEIHPGGGGAVNPYPTLSKYC